MNWKNNFFFWSATCTYNFFILIIMQSRRQQMFESFLCLRLLKLLPQNHFFPASIAEIAAVIPNGTKIVFAKGTATFINGPANDPKNPLNWIILEIWALESFMSVDILLLCYSMHFLASFFCLLSILILEADHFHQKFSDSFLKLFLCLKYSSFQFSQLCIW